MDRLVNGSHAKMGDTGTLGPGMGTVLEGDIPEWRKKNIPRATSERTITASLKRRRKRRPVLSTKKAARIPANSSMTPNIIVEVYSSMEEPPADLNMSTV